MLICEDLLLLMTDDETGKRVAIGYELTYPLAGALLADLTLSGHIRRTEPGEKIRRNRIVIDPDVPPPTDPLLLQAYRHLATQSKWFAQTALQTLSWGLTKKVVERLVHAEELSAVKDSVLGIFPVTRYVAVSSRREQQVRRDIDRLLLEDGEGDARTAVLVALLFATGKLLAAIDQGRGLDKAELRRRAKAILDQYWQAKATYDVIVAARGAAAG